MSAGSPHPEAETGGPFEGGGPVLAAGCSVEPPTGATADAESTDGREALSGDTWAAVEALAALLEPEAFNPNQLADETWREATRQRALGHAAKVVTSGWRRVMEDDDTIERLAQAMWFGPPAWSALIVQEEYAPIWRAKARAAVRALREET